MSGGATTRSTTWRSGPIRTAMLAAALALCADAASAQEIEPRVYVNTPTGLNFIAFGYMFQSGNVLFDPSLPITDANAGVHVAFARYLRTLSIAGKPARVAVLLPGVSGRWEGFLDDQFRTRDADGSGDVRLGLDVLLWGAEPRRLGEPTDPDGKTIVGAGLVVNVPTGTYDNDRLINLGSNRWAARPQVGVSRSMGNWTLEGIGAVWLFGDNDDFLGGSRLTQERLWVLKGDVVYSFRSGMWLGLGAGYGRGGTTKINGVVRNTLQTNWRFGGTFAYAIGRQHGVSATVLSGLTTRVGADFDSFGFAYQYQWGGQ